MNRWSALALLLAVAGALALRCARLDTRPLHNDEAINAVKLAALVERGEYKYDPHEFHGPTLYYAARMFVWGNPASNTDGFSDAALRRVTVAFGVGLILLLLLMRDGLGQFATACAAVLLAISPAMVFYSRYFIHEMLLVFFTLMTLAAGWRYTQTRKAGWAALTGAGIGLMFATKETFVLSMFAMVVATFATAGWNRWRAKQSAPASDTARFKRTSHRSGSKTVARVLNTFLGAITVLLVWFILFSSFFSNWRGLMDSFTTYFIWLDRAGGNSPHIHSWSFYLERLLWFHQSKGPVWSEAAILILAATGAGFAFSGNRAAVAQPALARFLVFYTLILAAIYSVLSYKTPWCLLNFWLGVILLAGIGAAALIQLRRRPATCAPVALLLLAAAAHLAWQAWSASTIHAASPNNPYVYAQTSPGIRELVERVQSVASVAPDGNETVVKVIFPESYWPLPWYLRSFKQTGWWEEMPSDPLSSIIIVSSKLDARLDEKSGRTHLMTGLYELRPGVFLELYVERGLWEKALPALPREQE